MKIVILVFSIMCLLSGNAFAGAKSKTDLDELQFLFKWAEMHGATLVKCGRESDYQAMQDSLVYIETAFRKLDKSFPEPRKPLLAQLQPRFDVLCDLIDCRVIEHNTTLTADCDKKTPAGKDYIMQTYVEAKEKVSTRLEKAGLSTNIKTDACPHSAQYYQDAYISNLRVEDFLCFKTVLGREYQRRR